LPREVNTTLLIVTCAVVGAVVGWFSTIVVDRVPRGRSVRFPPSECGSCHTPLTLPDLVPIASWLVRRGRCRHCTAEIGLEPIVIEVATATIFVLLGLELGIDAALPAFWVLGAALVALGWIDIRELRLPREITYPALVLGAAMLAIAAVVDGEPERIAGSLLGAATALAIMGGLHLLTRGGVGSGDVRLAPLLGMFLGYLDPVLVPLGLFVGFVFGAVAAVLALVTGRGTRRTSLPFGPFLAAGTLIAVLHGRSMIDRLWHG
jgi:leader peptidase (prepilin peptidase)/N-methyltransferase